jgi:hypothetical protein
LRLRGYDSGAVLQKAKEAGIQAVIPPKKNRKDQRDDDKHIYNIWWKTPSRTSSFLTAVQIRCIAYGPIFRDNTVPNVPFEAHP